jgi:hypothetical protein
VLLSFIATCQRNAVEPFGWFCDVLLRIATHPINKIEAWLPHNWKALSAAAGPDITQNSQGSNRKRKAVHQTLTSITIDERYCRGDWAAPKSDASNTTIPVNRKVIERIQRLRTLTVEVKAGRAALPGREV